MPKFLEIGKDFAEQLKKDNIAVFAAGVAFFFFLSLAPITMIVCSALSFFPDIRDSLLLTVIDITPDSFVPLAITLISQIYERTGKILPIAILVTIWTSGKGMLGLMRALNEVNEVEENRSYIVLRIMASFYMLVTVGGILVTLGLSILGQSAIDGLTGMFPGLSTLLYWVSGFRFLIIWALLAVAFCLIFTYIPNKELKLRYQIPGAVFTAISWSVFSYLFFLYISHTRALSLYGSLSTIFLLMLWMYFCIYIMLVGANLNKYFKPVIQVFMKKK